MKKILCVCFGNSCRSPMIEGWVKFMLDDLEVEVESAGTSLEFASQGEVTDKSAVAMRAYEIEISNHKSRHVGDLDLSSFDFFLTTGPDINQSLLQLGVPPEKIMTVGAENGIPNPYQKDQNEYDRCCDAIRDWFFLEGGLGQVLEKLDLQWISEKEFEEILKKGVID